MQNFSDPIVVKRILGYKDNVPAEELGSMFVAKADNVFVSDNQITKVFGSTALAASIATRSFNGLGELENQSSGNKYTIVNINGASVSQGYSWNGSGSFTAISGLTSTNNTPMWFEVANDLIFGFDGANVWDFDGTTATKNRSGVPVGKVAQWFHNYLFVSGVTAFPNRLYWSNLGDPTTFNGANYVDINPGDGDSIVSFASIQDELVVFKRETIWSVTGFSGTTFSTTTIATQNTNARIIGYGCIAPFSVVVTGNDAYFASYLGNNVVIRSLKKTQLATTLGGGVISNDINVTLKGVTKSALASISGIFDGRYIHWAVPTNSSSLNNQIIVLDTYNMIKVKGIIEYPWTTMSGKNVSYFCLSTIPGFATVFFTDSGTTGLVFKFDTSVSTDNGANIKMDLITRSYMPDAARKQKWKYLYARYATGVSSTITINARVDEGSTYYLQDSVSLVSNSPGLDSFILDVSLLDGTMTKRQRTTFKQLTGKTLSVEFTETSANPVTIYDHEIYFLPKGLRGT